LVFIVFSVAVFERNEQEKDDARADRWQLAYAQKAREANAMRIERDSARALLFRSPYAPDCERDSVPNWIVSLDILPKGRIGVLANRQAGGIEAGSRQEMAMRVFMARFEYLRALGEARGCRFLAFVNDRSDSKAEYKAAMGSLQWIFRPRGAFR
jgi:hypothetical protein